VRVKLVEKVPATKVVQQVKEIYTETEKVMCTLFYRWSHNYLGHLQQGIENVGTIE
jgi:hypothetical protein